MMMDEDEPRVSTFCRRPPYLRQALGMLCFGLAGSAAGAALGLCAVKAGDCLHSSGYNVNYLEVGGASDTALLSAVGNCVATAPGWIIPPLSLALRRAAGAEHAHMPLSHPPLQPHPPLRQSPMRPGMDWQLGSRLSAQAGGGWVCLCYLRCCSWPVQRPSCVTPRWYRRAMHCRAVPLPLRRAQLAVPLPTVATQIRSLFFNGLLTTHAQGDFLSRYQSLSGAHFAPPHLVDFARRIKSAWMRWSTRDFHSESCSRSTPPSLHHLLLLALPPTQLSPRAFRTG
jgi:hypothetical protein